MIISLGKRAARFSLIVVLLCLSVSSCSSPAASPTASGNQELLLPIPLSSFPISCDSEEMAPVETMDPSEVFSLSLGLFAPPRNELSLHLVLDQATFQYASPVSFRLIVSNETDYPVIFFRPRFVSFGEELLQSDFVIQLTTLSGQPVTPVPADRDSFPSREISQKDFTMLPPRASCTMALQLTTEAAKWALGSPISPGEYQMNVTLHVFDESLRSDGEEDKVVAWMGWTKPSNTAALIILPPRE